MSSLAEKLETLPPEQQAEVEDFVDFLRLKSDRKNLVRDFTTASESTLRKIWDNEYDATYDNL